ncbi:dTMP kinase [Brevibacterium salitolerans]|uniref:Thymidylate kinase n=1 Tax=Brevibacterium salitolerans TaxID=1403566 RepID=A0ABN2WUT8_9MICO
MSEQGSANPAPALGAQQPAAVAPVVVEAGAWLAMLALAGLAFSLAGAFGLTGRADPSMLTGIREAAAGGDFALRTAVIAYALVGIVAAAGVFLPVRRWGGSLSLRIAAGAALVAAVLSFVLLFVLTAWLSILTAAVAGIAVVMVLGVLSNPHRKPWRSAGIPVVLLLVVTYGAQLLGGVGAGHTVLRWMAVLGCLVVLVGVLLLLTGRAPQPGEAPQIGAFPSAPRMSVREAVPVKNAWACHFLFFVLGAVGILAQPAVAELGFGQAGTALIVCAVLLGWAVGFETGPTFAPGMSRPRLTSFALIAAGVLTIGAGALTELSGKAVLSGAVAFLVGLGVRAQDYAFSRRVGAGLGMLAGLLLTLAGVSAEIPLSDAASWNLTSTEFAYEVVGVVALIAGIAALFAFGPHGIHGIGVDVVHAFRIPAVRTEDRTASEATEDTLRSTDAAAPGSSEALLGSTGDDAGPASPPAPGDLSSALTVPTASAASAGGAGGAGRGLFIALEGGDGTGKSTQIHLLAEALRERGITEVVTTREPGGTEPGGRLRSVVLDGDGVSPRAEALVFAADRAHHVATLVRPIVERGGVVITDRYIDSSRAYQAAGRALGDEEIAALSRWATEGLVPDLTLVLDADPASLAGRLSARGEQNHLDREDAAFRETVRRSFLEYAAQEPERYRVIDAGGSVDDVAARLLEAVTAVLDGAPAARPAPAEDGTAGTYSDEAPTVVSPAVRSAQPSAGSPHQGDGGRAAAQPLRDADEAPTLVHRVAAPPAGPTAPEADTAAEPKPAAPRQTSRERLRAQAEIERQARERLRSQRDGRQP